MNPLPFKLSISQEKGIIKAIEHATPSFRYPKGLELEETLACGYSTYIETHKITILQFDEDERYSVRWAETDIELTPTEIDIFLNSVLKFEHLPRAERSSNGKIESITTSANNGVTPRVQKALKKLDFDLPKGKKIEFLNAAYERTYPKLKELKSDAEIQEYVFNILADAHWAQKFVLDNKIIKTREILESAGQAHNVKIRKRHESKALREAKTSQKKSEKKFVFIKQKFNETLKPQEVNVMRMLGKDPNNPADVKYYLERTRGA